jgi:nucleoside-diphosphate-sugar epimerase
VLCHPLSPHVESGTDCDTWQNNASLAADGRSWIDVRDLALAHRLALEKEAAGGERIIPSAGPIKWQDLRAYHALLIALRCSTGTDGRFLLPVDAANAVGASGYPGLALQKGNPGAGSAAPGNVHHVQYNADKAARVLGMGHDEDVTEVRYRTLEETARDILVDAKERGWK